MNVRCFAFISFALFALASSTQSAPGDLAPIVDSGGLLLGASQGGKWIKASEAIKKLKGGERYRFFGFDGPAGTHLGAKPELDQASGAAWFVPFQNRADTFNKPLVGVGGSGNPQPRKAKSLDRIRTADSIKGAYHRTVSNVLAKHGLKVKTPRIVKLYRVDLTGKGDDSVLIEAASPKYAVMPTEMKGKLAYSVVILRTVVNGKVQTFELGGEFLKPGAPSDAPNEYNLLPPLDLNCDGVLEILIGSHYYEGGGSAVYELKNGKPKLVLDEVAGA